MTKPLSCIKQVPIFRTLPEASMAKLYRVAKHRHFLLGNQVIGAGMPVRYLLVVVHGGLQLSKANKHGREQVIRRLGPGDFYGELALFTDLESEGVLQAVVATDVCILECETVREILQETPNVAWPMLESLANRLAQSERLVADLGLLDVGERLVSQLLYLAEKGTETEHGVKVSLPFSWGQLATQLGTTPESLSRRLRTLSQAGLVQTSGRDILLPNLKNLRDIISSSADKP